MKAELFLVFFLIILGMIVFVVLVTSDFFENYKITHAKYKIVKRTHKDGHFSFVVKSKVHLFWTIDTWDYWYGPGICEIRAVFNSLEEAKNHIEWRKGMAAAIVGEKITHKNKIEL